MEAFLTMLKSVLLFVVMALPGYLFVKTKFLKEEQSAPLSKLLTHLGLPFLVISNLLNVELNLAFIQNVALLMGVSFLALILGMLGTKYLVRRVDDRKKQGMMRFCMVFANNGFLGIPLAKAVFGDSVVVTYASLFSILFNLFMYTLGVYWISGDKRAMNVKKACTTPILIAFLVGLTLNLLNVKEMIPQVTEYANHFSGLVTPLSMTVLGMKLGGIEIKRLFTSTATYWVAVCKLVLMPTLAIGLFLSLRLVIPVPDFLLYATFIGFATPSPALSSAFADQHEGDIKGAAMYTLGTTLLSVLTIPILYWALSSIL